MATDPNADKPFTQVLVIMAHPDDAEFSCAGVVKQLTEQGATVTYVVLTNGDKGNHDLGITTAAVVERRMAEQLAAAKLLGSRMSVFWGKRTGFCNPRASCANAWCASSVNSSPT